MWNNWAQSRLSRPPFNARDMTNSCSKKLWKETICGTGGSHVPQKNPVETSFPQFTDPAQMKRGARPAEESTESLQADKKCPRLLDLLNPDGERIKTWEVCRGKRDNWVGPGSNSASCREMSPLCLPPEPAWDWLCVSWSWQALSAQRHPTAVAG